METNSPPPPHVSLLIKPSFMISSSSLPASSEVKLEIKIGIVKLVDPHITILAPAGIALPVRVELNRVDRAKVTLHPPKLLLEDQVEEAGVELADLGGGGGDVHGVLSAAQDDLVKDGADGGGVDGSLRAVLLQHLQAVRIP